MEDLHPEIGRVRRQMESRWPEEAGDAQAALEWLVGDAGPAALTQHGLQEFLWYYLPAKWMTDAAHHHRVALHLARALELLGMPRYAALCRSEQTR